MNFNPVHIACLLTLALVVMMTGAYHAYYHGNAVKSIGAGILYFAGLYGLHSMRTSLHYKEREKRLLSLFVSFIMVLIAWLSLETLFLQWGRL